MLPSQSESDDDKYVPAGLLSSAENPFEIKHEFKVNEICEFYNNSKPVSSVVEKSSRESNIFVDLSEKSDQLTPNVLLKSKTSVTQKPPVPHLRVLTIPPGSHVPQLPTDAPRLPPPATRPYIPRAIQVSQLRPNNYRPISYSLPGPAMYPDPGRPLPYQQTINSFCPSGLISGKPVPRGTIIPNIFAHTYMTPLQPQVNSMGTVISPGMMAVSQAVPVMHPVNIYPPRPNTDEVKKKSPELKAKLSPDARKRLRLESAAKLKAEREARKAEIKAKKLAAKVKKSAAIKKKKESAIAESNNRKFANFSKDMFVIRLKDIDSFNRNNEIWRIDNHVLIQKFCGVPSLRAPARQFQSTNRMSGYDSRATWRLFIINPDSVEIDKYGSEVTIHDFPTITVLREAKQLAELKDGAFKEIEKSEFNEKLHKFQAKRKSKIEAKLKRRLERKQKKLKAKRGRKSVSSDTSHKVSGSSIAWEDIDLEETSLDFKNENDEDVCRDIMNSMLDAIVDDDYDDEDSSLYSDGDISFIDDEDDAGSLISLANSSDDEDDNKLELYGEDEVPAVALELVVD